MNSKQSKLIADLRVRLGVAWIPQIYEEKVRPMRTRSFELGTAGRENEPQIMHTLLGVELKVGKRRTACPDLATARYLAVFARVGCTEVAVPYDITKLSALADELETGWHRLRLIFAEEGNNISISPKGRQWSAVVRSIRDEIKAIGAGTKMPLFNRSTKQRPN